jgi:transcription-repair coupling factor (superfamily II helicase)
MLDKISLYSKLEEVQDSQLSINGISANQWLFFYSFYLNNTNSQFKKNIFIFDTDEEAEKFLDTGRSHLNNLLYYPDIGSDVYSSIIPSEKNLFQRFNLLNSIADLTVNSTFNIVTTFSAAHLFVPPQDFFSTGSFIISVSDIIAPDELALKLITMGYVHAPTIEEPGTFTKKGEIFDIYPLNSKPIRLHYFDDMIEEIFAVDPETLKTLRKYSIDKVNISKTPYSLLSDEFVMNFRKNLPRPPLSKRELVSYRESILKKIGNQQFFEDYPLFISYFLRQSSSLFSYLDDFKIHMFNNFTTVDSFDHKMSDFKESCETYQQHEEEIIKPDYTMVYSSNKFNSNSCFNINDINIQIDLEKDIDSTLDIKLLTLSHFNPQLLKTQSKSEKIIALVKMIQETLDKSHKVIITFKHENSLSEIKYILETSSESVHYLSKIQYVPFDLDSGFFYKTENLLVLSENDFFAKKISKAKRSKNRTKDLFAEQISTLVEGDHVIHKEFGVGKYLGMETLTLSGSTSDFIVIEYQDNDKVYVPVYKLNLIQKHSSKSAVVPLSNLKTKKFDTAKSKAKSAVKKLAFDLLELQAKRKLLESFQFSPPDHEYNEFSLSFKFEETPDQATAIEDVLHDMQSSKPMDRLICGDVGFGKTEIAMRAAFKAVLDKKQVCILVPTTVLAYQHYNSFIERFKNFPVNIDFLSRFRTAKEKKIILQNMNEGKIDIIIGTHTLLSNNIQFFDLGLMIVDEEQRFGVAHKEKLRLMRETIDTLTLSATPIPRTLQMSFLGIKDLSLIKTAPPRRQSIKTYLIKEDINTLRNAINKELSRGGQVFIVHNKVSDIEIFTSKIRQLVPSAKIIFAHGQLPERELEKRISDFYDKKYDILISTTIIESGIDIPSANTMIIDRADTFGLSQLHQLRGRIGRSDKKAYAYFMLPTHKKMSDVAAKRLKALQTYADLGSGFALASSDLEIRGSGDVLGPEQSGHIGSVGLELYMELLQDALNELKGENKLLSKKIEIQTPFNAYIPDKYVANDGMRLKYYKKISNSMNISELTEIADELTDLYGHAPIEFQNLIKIMQSKIYLQNYAIQNIKVKSSSIDFKFDKSLITSDKKLQETVLSFFMQRPKVYKLNPDFSINCKFKDKITIDTFLDFAKHIAEQIQTC